METSSDSPGESSVVVVVDSQTHPSLPFPSNQKNIDSDENNSQESESNNSTTHSTNDNNKRSNDALAKSLSTMLATVIKDFDSKAQDTLKSQDHLNSAIDRLTRGNF